MREDSSSTSQNRHSDAAFVTVHSPKPHEGVGQALRQVYSAERNSLPADMSELLDRLDRR